MATNPSKLTRRAATVMMGEITQAANLLSMELGAAALAKSEQWEGFLRSSPGGSRGGAALTPTEAAAEASLAAQGWTEPPREGADDNAGARTQFCADLMTVHTLIRSLEQRAREWTSTKVREDPTKWCALCQVHANKLVAKLGVKAPVEGARAMPRCEWHYDFCKAWGEDAVQEETIQHVSNPGRGNALTDAMIERNHPEAFAARKAGQTAPRTAHDSQARLVKTGALGATGTWKDRTA